MEREKLIDLVQRTQQGQPAAMEELFSSFYNDVYYFALKTVKDEDIACDITQETFVEIIRTIGDLREPAAFVRWMKQITYHRCTRYFSKKTELLVDEDEDGNTIFDTLADQREGALPAEVVEQEDFRRTIMEMVDTLSEEQRAAVMLYYFDEMTVGQIAQIQNVSEGTVKSRLNYARKALKKSVEDYEKKHDIKLHSFAPLALFLLYFGKEAMPAAKAAGVHAAVMANATGAVAAAGASAGTATAAGVAGTATATAAKAAAIPLAAKIIAGVVAATLVIGGVTIAVAPDKKADDAKEKLVAEHTQEEKNLLILHEPSSEYQDVFQDYLFAGMKWIRTNDGRLLCYGEDGELIEEISDIQGEVNVFYNNQAFWYDNSGLLHVLYNGGILTFPNVQGNLFDFRRSFDLDNTAYKEEHGYSPNLYALSTYDENGVARYYEYSLGECKFQTEMFLCDYERYKQTGNGDLPVPADGFYPYNEHDILNTQNAFLSNGFLYLLYDNRLPYNTSYDSVSNTYRQMVSNTGIPATKILSSTYAALVFIGNEKDVVYIYQGQTFEGAREDEYDLHSVTLPKGKTTDQILRAVVREHGAGIFLFDDGSIYIKKDICKHKTDEEPCTFSNKLVYSETLTNLYQEGKIKDFHVNDVLPSQYEQAQGESSYDNFFLVISQDNLTYWIDETYFSKS